MRTSRFLLLFALLGLGYLGTTSLAHRFPSPPKFSGSNQAKFPKACGDGLDEHSACGDCAYVQGVGVTKSTRCGHVCVKIPDNKSDKDMNLTATAAEDSAAPAFQACGQPNTPGPCAVGWARFEGNEYYPDKHELCGRFKNWSADRARIFQVVITEK